MGELYNCTYELLVGISFLDDLTLGQKVELAKKGITFAELEKRLGDVRCRRWNQELEWADYGADGLSRGHVFFGEDDYPQSLLADSKAPFFLAWKGSKPCGIGGTLYDAMSIAITGSRNSNQEGRRAAYLLALEAAANGIAVYTGYATGAEQAAVKGAVLAGGRAFAVLPCGLADDYASRNPELLEGIHAGGGGLVSQFHSGEEPLKWNFLSRNRTLAAIGDATVVVQAPEKSNSLLLVKDAVACGRDVFVHSEGVGSEDICLGTRGLANDGVPVISCYSDLSKLTMGGFALACHAEEIPYEDVKRIVDSNAVHEKIFRFGDKWYHLVPDDDPFQWQRVRTWFADEEDEDLGRGR